VRFSERIVVRKPIAREQGLNRCCSGGLQNEKGRPS
jgi:hypothetical protein